MKIPESFPLRLGLFALAYWASAELSYELLFKPGNFATIWPPAGIYLALLVSTPFRRWWAVAASAGGANLFSDFVVHQQPFWLSLGFLLVNLTAPLVGAALIRKWCRPVLSFESLQHVFRWSLIVIFVITPGSALGGATLITAAHGGVFQREWFMWWIGDLLGVLVAMPLTYGLLGWRTWPPRTQVLEATALLVSLGAATWLLYRMPNTFALPPAVLFLFLMWAALRFGATAVAAAAALLAIFAIKLTEVGFGAYNIQMEPPARLLMAQMLVVTGALLFYILNAVMAERRAAEDLIERRQAEEALRESETRYRMLFESIDEGFCIIEFFDGPHGPLSDYVHVEANPAYTINAGIPNIVGQKVREIVPDEADGWVEIYRNVLITGEPVRFERELVATGRHLELAAFRIEPPERKQVAVLFKDATDRKRAEAALRESEARFRNMADHAPVMVWMTEPDASCSYLSLSWYEFTGQTPETGLGFGWLNATHPEDAAEAERIFVAANEQRLAFQLEYRLRRKDGSYAWAIDSAQPRFSATGDFLGYIGSVIDITERKRVEEALRESKARFDIVKDSAQVGFWFCDLPFDELVWDNHVKEHFWLPPDAKVTIDTFYEQLHPEDRERTRRAIDESINNQTHYEIEYRTVAPDGREKWIRAVGRTFYDSQKNPTRFDGVTLDITDRKHSEAERERLLTQEQQARAAAENATRAKDEFLAIVSHELRNPLNSMLGYARLMRDNPHDAVQVANYAEVVERNARMQQQLIEDLLDTARIISGKLKIETAPTDLRLVLADAVAVVRPAAEAKQIELHTLLGNEPQPLIGDAARLQQVAWNILQNAIKFTPVQGRVEVRLEKTADNQLRLIVSDTGKGIEPEFQSTIFDRFTQQDMSSTRRHGGLGLGLTLAKQLVELHGGLISVASSGRDQGSTFTVTLPQRTNLTIQATRALSISDQVAINPINGKGRLKGLRLLVVDDQEEARQLVAHVLQEGGAVVTALASGLDALALLEQQESFDALICDIAMPDMDGYEVARRLREQHRHWQRLPAIALTAHSRPQDRLRALAAGFQMHVIKPVEPEELITVIASLTGRL